MYLSAHIGEWVGIDDGFTHQKPILCLLHFLCLLPLDSIALSKIS